MQRSIKNESLRVYLRGLLYRLILSSILLFVGLFMAILLIGPLNLLEKMLVWNGHKARGMSLSFGETISFSMDELSLLDQNKTLEIRGLNISLPLSSNREDLASEVTIKAERIHFVDETKPTESLSFFLSKFKDPASEQQHSFSTCVRALEIQSVEFGVSHSAELWKVDDLEIGRPCFLPDEIKFDYFKLKSEVFTMMESSLDLKISPNHFYDLEIEKTLRFNRTEKSIKLTRPELVEIN